MEGQKPPGFISNIFICALKKSYWFGMTWGEVDYDRIVIFGQNIPST